MAHFAGTTIRRLVRDSRGGREPAHGYRGAIALLAAEADEPAFEPLCDALARQLGAQGTTFVVSAAACDGVLGRAGAHAAELDAEDEATLARWLGDTRATDLSPLLHLTWASVPSPEPSATLSNAKARELPCPPDRGRS